jgi:hypothetical protein
MNNPESYMNGWRSGYHNAKLAERDRIIKLLKTEWTIQFELGNDDGAFFLSETIKLISEEKQ